jgi:cell fate (sporulation/competence/biofilm development) regulator YlbF (YheA/YmcA/DUF963 family)
METTPQGSVLLQKTRELCSALAETTEFQSIRQRIERFTADESARGQYEFLNLRGGQLQEKQQMGVPLDDAEIAEFEARRAAFIANPVAQDFLTAREEMIELQDTIARHVGKTFELGRLPKISEMAASCGSDCGCAKGE